MENPGTPTFPRHQNEPDYLSQPTASDAADNPFTQDRNTQQRGQGPPMDEQYPPPYCEIYDHRAAPRLAAEDLPTVNTRAQYS